MSGEDSHDGFHEGIPWRKVDTPVTKTKGEGIVSKLVQLATRPLDRHLFDGICSSEDTMDSPAAMKENQQASVAAVNVALAGATVAINNADQQEPDRCIPARCIPAHEDFERIRSKMADIFKEASTKVESGELPLIGWGLSQPRVQHLESCHEGKTWYFIGDIHGDFLAWHCLFERVRQNEDFRLCFLGDLVDRGPYHLECFAALLEAAQRYPNQILWILGNHDEVLSYDPNKKQFISSVEPSEFSEWLNTPHDDFSARQLEDWGNLFVAVCRSLPRAILFSDGLLATHGGVPLQDRWETLNNMEAFNHQRTLADFTWTRAASFPSKLGWKIDPERRKKSSDFSFGYKDLDGFCKAVEEVFPVKRIVRGHDHVQDGWELPEGYKSVPVLTINGFGFNYLSNSTEKYRLRLTLGVGIPGELPRVEEVPYTAEEYANMHPSTKAVSTPV
jgi:hypothetical protein